MKKDRLKEFRERKTYNKKVQEAKKVGDFLKSSFPGKDVTCSSVIGKKFVVRIGKSDIPVIMSKLLTLGLTRDDVEFMGSGDKEIAFQSWVSSRD